MRGFQEHQICNFLRRNGDSTAAQVGTALHKPDVPLFSHVRRETWARKKLESLVRKGYVKRLEDGRYSVNIQDVPACKIAQEWNT